jgi:hypothetical protein
MPICRANWLTVIPVRFDQMSDHLGGLDVAHVELQSFVLFVIIDQPREDFEVIRNSHIRRLLML